MSTQTVNPGPEASIAAYVAALEAMRADTVDTVLALCAEDIRFSDPFTDVTGKAALRDVYDDMFRKISDLRFRVEDCHGAGERWLIRWTYSARLGFLGPMEFVGTSLVLLNAEGLVCRHADYWDASALFARLPVLGPIVRLIKRRIAAP